MTKLPAVRPAKAIKALERAGFQLDRISGSHYHFKHPTDPTLFVSVPYHNKDLKTGTLAAIIKQSGMTVEEFKKLL
ncbi:MAG TPA: type II toxin-antitoxin system HicA family toxin [Pyrinomonadaceae bacterium]|jgi:predicted RNA binding protein YcfA (HicA-like mRNA interferase family)|nr:type II toxin-antitoxin system HicA family toxin [Pyrinomonadaceae bacterium]